MTDATQSLPSCPEALPAEDSFARLKDQAPLLLSLATEQVGRALEIIFQWLPASVQWAEADGRVQVLATGLNSFQVLRLLEEGFPLRYRDENRVYVPWGSRLVDPLPPNTIAGPDGCPAGILEQAGLGYREWVRPALPPIEVETCHEELHVELPLRLSPNRTPPPALLWYRAGSLQRLVRWLGWDRPPGRFGRNVTSFQSCRFILLEHASGPSVLVRLARGIDGLSSGQAEEAAGTADRSFYSPFLGQVFVEAGWLITPEIPEAAFYKIFEPGFLHLLFTEAGESRLLKLNPFEYLSYPLTDLGKLALTLQQARVHRFLGGAAASSLTSP